MKLIFTLILFLFTSLELLPQKVVVSEYFNSASVNNEWSELLVIEDNISLVGFTLRDNSQSDLSQWAGGVKFKDVSLWKNLRRGTIIVINHRNNITTNDIDPKDGYIELNAENSTYFDKVIYCSGCNLGSWGLVALSILQQNDIIQIRDENDNHVHALAHMSSPTGLWSSISTQKISSPASVASDNSVRVVPGRTLTEYNVGFDNSGIYTGNSTQFTKGRPNTSVAFPLENYKFWHNLRKPDWTSPKVTATIKTYGVDLSWNIMTDSYPVDNYQGYLILKVPYIESDNAARPSDGKSYSVGEKLGSAVVVANVFNSTVSTFSDYFDFKCGESYIYQIFAFRYRYDDLGDDAVAFYQKGRIYISSAQFLSENNFAQSKIVEKPIPVLQLLTIKSGSKVNCIGNSTILTFYPSNDTMKIEWFRDNLLLSGQTKDTLVANVSGIYTAKLTSKNGCFKISNPLQLSFIQTPVTKLAIDSKYLTKDTTITICNNQSITLRAEGGDSLIFYKNNKPVFIGKSLIVKDAGTYKVVGINQKQCADTSYLLFLKVINTNYQISKVRIDYNLANNEFSKDDSLIITNNSSDTIFFDDIKLNQYFEIFSPNKPYTINPHSIKTFVVRFKTTKDGLFEDVIYFRSGCDKIDSVLLVGIKANTKLSSSLADLTFPNILNCKLISKDSILILKNSGDAKVTLSKPIVNKPFEVLNNDLPFDLLKNDEYEIRLKFNPYLEGDYSEILSIPYSSNTEKDTLKIKLSGKMIDPKFVLPNKVIDFAYFSACSDWIDTTILINNPNSIDLTIKNNSYPDFNIKTLPIILKAKETTVVNVSFKLDDGTFDKFYNIQTEPCSFIDSIRITGNKKGAIFSFSADTVDFGEIVINCGDSIKTIDFQIAVNDLSKSPILTSFKLINNDNLNYSFTGKDSSKLEVNNLFKVIFSPKNDGEFNSFLDLNLEPCNILKRVYLKGKRTTLLISTDQKDINFGKQPIPVNLKQSIRLTNSGTNNVKFNGIKGIKPPFSVSNQFPFIIDKSDNKLIEFNYLQPKISKDTQTVYLQMTEPCVLDYPILLKGDSFDKDIDTNIYNLSIIVGNDSANVGETASIPISIFTANKKDLIKSGIYQITAKYSFNPTVLYPTEVEQEQSGKIDKNEYIEVSPGVFLVNTHIYPKDSLTDGLIYTIKFKALYGNSDFTSINLDSLEIKSTKIIEIDSIQNGFFKKLGGQKFDFEYLLTATYITFDPILEKYKFKVFTPIKDNINIKIYNTLGQEVFSETKEFNSGLTEYIFDSSKLPFGAYFIEFRNNTSKSIVNFTVVR